MSPRCRRVSLCAMPMATSRRSANSRSWLAWRHRLFDIATSFREGSWVWSPMVGGAVRSEIGGQTVGIVGLGHIGREVAWRAAALGCRVLAANRTMRERPASVEHIFPWTELDRMLGECDIVVLSC